MSTPNKYGSNRTKAQAVSEQSGYNGGLYITTTTRFAFNCTKIVAVADAVIALLENDTSGPILQGTLTAIPLPAAGQPITGKFSAITLTSGKVIAYA